MKIIFLLTFLMTINYSLVFSFENEGKYEIFGVKLSKQKKNLKFIFIEKVRKNLIKFYNLDLKA